MVIVFPQWNVAGRLNASISNMVLQDGTASRLAAQALTVPAQRGSCGRLEDD